MNMFKVVILSPSTKYDEKRQFVMQTGDVYMLMISVSLNSF